MAFGAVLAVPFGQMAWSAGILAEVTPYACRYGVSIDTVFVAISAFRRAMSPDKRVSCLAVIEQGRGPRPLAVALGTTDTAELVEVRVYMALITIAAYFFVLSFYLMTVYAEDLIVYALKLKTGPLFMFKLPWFPVLRRMT